MDLDLRKHDFGEQGSVAFVDDLLAPPAFKAMANLGENARLLPVTDFDPTGGWRQNIPFNPTQSKPIVWAEDETFAPAVNALDNVDTFPMGNQIDVALRAIRNVVIESGMLGSPGTDWIGCAATLFDYGPGSRLLWHNDDSYYAGAFSYYIHRKWDDNAGGHFLYRPQTDQANMDGGFISPKPNRLVILKPPLAHAVTPIVNDDRFHRIALTGFFIRPQGAENLIEMFASL